MTASAPESPPPLDVALGPVVKQGRLAETLVVALGLAIVMFGQTTGFRNPVLFTRPLWLDEYHTLLPARTANGMQMLADVRQGADFNPPLLHTLYWLVGKVFPLEPWVLRVVSFVAVWVALVMVFGLLRRSLPLGAAAAGILAIWAQPQIIAHAFEARFYGPWLLLSAATIWAALRCVESPAHRWRWLCALLAALLCTIHYFGVFAWTLIAVALLLTARGRMAERLRRLSPLLAGPAALMLCLPFYLGQKQALSVPTWIGPMTANSAVRFLARFIYSLPWLLAAILALWAWRRSASAPRAERPRPRLGVDPALLGLFSLIVLGPILVAFSATAQPALQHRYALPAFLAIGAVTGWLLRHARPWAVAAMIVVLLTIGTVESSRARWQADGWTAGSRKDLAALEELDAGIPVLFPSRHRLYRIAESAGPHAQRSYFLDFEPTRGVSDYHVLERDVGRVHHRMYGLPRMAGLDEVRSWPRFYVFGEAFFADWFPEHEMRDASGEVKEFSRRPTASAGGR